MRPAATAVAQRAVAPRPPKVKKCGATSPSRRRALGERADDRVGRARAEQVLDQAGIAGERAAPRRATPQTPRSASAS